MSAQNNANFEAVEALSRIPYQRFADAINQHAVRRYWLSFFHG